MRERPVGFDKERKNIFDLEEDPEPEQEPTILENERTNGNDDAHHGESTETDAIVAPDSKNKATSVTHTCAREGCTRKPRFDSLFCSDSCGVSALELDLLRSYEESSDIHPSVLRN
jgi:hypothetical protein